MKTRSNRNERPEPAESAGSPLSELSPRDASGKLLHVVVDTPRGSRIKFKYDPEKRCYTPSHLLPPGTIFPFDFGSIPSTLAEDGDPLDVLILLEEPSFAGCLVPVRPIGVLEAKQTVEGKTSRNDRLIGVAETSRLFRDLRTLKDVPGRLGEEIEGFFVFYNEERGRKFEVLGRFGPARAARLVDAGARRFRKTKAARR
jgi:inorganic pyrophosphatase